MRLNFLSLAACLCLAAEANGARADEGWVHVGDLQFKNPWVTGKLSVDLSTLRKRAHHYEIWERVKTEVDPARPFAALPVDDNPVRLTLWAIHCRHGSMARITEGIPGSFEPRAEALKFHVPAPDGTGAAVIETACAEVRRLAADNGSAQLPPEIPKLEAGVRPELDHPPPPNFNEEDVEEE